MTEWMEKVWHESRDGLCERIVREGATNRVIIEALNAAYSEGHLRGWADRARVDRERNGVSEP